MSAYGNKKRAAEAYAKAAGPAPKKRGGGVENHGQLTFPSQAVCVPRDLEQKFADGIKHVSLKSGYVYTINLKGCN